MIEKGKKNFRTKTSPHKWPKRKKGIGQSICFSDFFSAARLDSEYFFIVVSKERTRSRRNYVKSSIKYEWRSSMKCHDMFVSMSLRQCLVNPSRYEGKSMTGFVKVSDIAAKPKALGGYVDNSRIHGAINVQTLEMTDNNRKRLQFNLNILTKDVLFSIVEYFLRCNKASLCSEIEFSWQQKGNSIVRRDCERLVK